MSSVSSEESLLVLDMFADIGIHKAMTVREVPSSAIWKIHFL